jgi:2-keto-4-pentenoate hydratase/2-oxohepta-3-ene-1,7-dioic acid hydratase in catechol pathway
MSAQMRFLRYAMPDGQNGLAIAASGNTWRGLTQSTPGYRSLDDLIAAGPDAIQESATRYRNAPEIDLQNIEYLPPLATPRKIICVGLNYRDHSAEAGFKQPDYPTLFTRYPTSLVGHRQPILHPAVSDTLDYEGELVAVIGRGGKNISHAQALSHVMGYSIFNDGSVREYQFKTPQWTMGKNFDASGACGPYLVTADELPAGAAGLKIQTRLNGAVVQQDNTGNLVFDLPTLISTISAAITLEPGDLIVTGTPSGVGFAREPKLYMRPGDVCEVEIEGIGVLSNPIAADRR